MRVAVFLAGAVWAVAASVPAHAQTAADHVKAGVAAQQAVKSEEALQHFQAALAADSLHYEASWRGAMTAIDVAQSPAQTGADSLYALAEAYARRAIEINREPAAGHFAVAYVLGSRSLVSDPLTRLGMAREIWQASSDAILLDPKHDGAHHILGQWYASIMRLSEFERSYATGELGEIAEKATWELALTNLEKAVELAPSIIYHRLDLARAYKDAGRPADAKAQAEKIASLAVAYPKDPEYKEQAKALLLEKPAADSTTE